jgi:hypothetical protein
MKSYVSLFSNFLNPSMVQPLSEVIQFLLSQVCCLGIISKTGGKEYMELELLKTESKNTTWS